MLNAAWPSYSDLIMKTQSFYLYLHLYLCMDLCMICIYEYENECALLCRYMQTGMSDQEWVLSQKNTLDYAGVRGRNVNKPCGGHCLAQLRVVIILFLYL